MRALPPRVLAAAAILCFSVLTQAGPQEGLGALVSVLREATDSSLQRDVLRGLKSALNGRPHVDPPAGWAELETQLAQSTDTEVRRLTQSLGLTFGSPAAQAALRAVAADRTAATADRNQAVAALLLARTPNLAELLQSLCDDPAIRPAAIRGLAQFDDPKTATVLLQGLPGWPLEHRRDALNTLASRATYARPLLDGIVAGRIGKAELTADLVRQLRNLKHADLNQQLTKVWGVMQEPNADMNAEIERTKRRYWAGGSTPGDASRGRAVFNQVCAQCHHLFDFGGQVGPDITGANRSDLDYLLQNILFPNAVIPNEYRQSVLETKDGRVLTGLIKSSDGAAYLLQTANELVTLPKGEVAKVEQLESSMMPEGLLAGLDDRQMRDLLYYLSRPGQVPLPTGK